MLNTAPALAPAPVAHQRPQLRLVPPPRPRPPHRARATAAYAFGLALGLFGVAAANLLSGAEGAALYGALAVIAASVAGAALVRTRAHARSADRS